ncbi:MAG: hypothetical protein ACE5I5_11385 [Candidatus Heimdallarchaeota archaeon]
MIKKMRKTKLILVLILLANMTIMTATSAPVSTQIIPPQTPSASDILVIDLEAGTNNQGALFQVNPATGTRTILTDFGNTAQGPLGLDPRGVTVEATGAILVIDQNAGTGGQGALFRVASVTGVRTLLSDFGNPAQGSLGSDPYGVVVEAAGTILVIDISARALFRVDPTTGVRTLFSDFGDATLGPQGATPADLAVESAGTILVIDWGVGTNGRGGLFRVDPTTGVRILLSDFGNSAKGPLGANPAGVAVETTGDILVTDLDAGTNHLLGLLFRVDPVTGVRTLLSDFGSSTQGPSGGNPWHMGVESSGTILVQDGCLGPNVCYGDLFRVDPATGTRMILTDFGNANQGPLGLNPSGVAIFTGLPPTVPVDLLQNGDFSQGLTHWTVIVQSGTATQTYNGPDWLNTRQLGPGWTDVQLVNEPGRTDVLDIVQTVDDGDGDWTGVSQTLDQEVSGFSELYFEADGKAMDQSLPGDGRAGGEYPVHFIIQYTDVTGVDHDAFLDRPVNPAWQQGFYYTAAGDPDGVLNPYSNLVTQNTWFHYTSPNLMNLSPAPKIIKTVRLFSSGWAYHGRIDNARLYGTPPPQVPVDLLQNGDFSQGLTHWTVIVQSGTATQTYNGPDWLNTRQLGPGWTDVQLVNEPGRTDVLDIVQTVDDGDGDWTGVSQTLDQEVSGFSELYFEADGKAMDQSLPGDGRAGGEYPVHFIIQYTDVTGVDHDAFLDRPVNPAWQQGFYYTAAGDPDGVLNPYSNLVTQNTWFHYTSPNLMNLSPAPKIIKTVRLFSSGWAYHGRIDNVRLYGSPPLGQPTTTTEEPKTTTEELTTTEEPKITITSPDETQETQPVETVTTTETEPIEGPLVPGFEVFPVFLAISFFLWFRQRRHRR